MKKRNLLLSSLALLVVAIVGFAGATYAWFITGTAPNVEELNVQVQSAGMIRIGVKGSDAYTTKPTVSRRDTDFVYTITEAMLQSATTPAVAGFYKNPNYSPAVPLDAITPQVTASPEALVTAPGVNGIDRIQFKAQDSAVGTIDGASDTLNYIAFDLYFMNVGAVGASPSYQVAFNTKDSYFGVKDTYSFMDRNTSAAQKAITASLRVGFVTYKWADADSEPTTPNVEIIDTIQVYEPETKTITQLASIPQITDGGAIQAIEENYIVPPTAPDATFNADYIMLFGSLNPAFDPNEPVPANNYQSEEILRLTIYIWVEGNDPDCVSLAAGGGFTTALQFLHTEV